jgi:cation-transporting ATPase F
MEKTRQARAAGRRPAPAANGTADPAHHGLPLHEVVLLLGSDHLQGLASAEVVRRQSQFGANVLPRSRGGGIFRKLARQFNNPLVYVLLAAAAVTLFLGEYLDSGVILAVVLVNTVIGFVQEVRAEAALDALHSLVRTRAVVVRDGQRQEVPSEDLVPGDLVILEAGDKVPADLRLVRLSGLRADESALTGESEAVEKDEVVLPPTTPVADRRNMVYSGTLVTAGTGAGVVVATGGETELGEIHRLMGSVQQIATPLTQKLAHFSMTLTVAILALAAVTFLAGVARGQQPAQMFTAAVALAVGAIPEGLPAAVTVTLAIGVRRMARRRAVVRRLPVVETLGSTTVICSDKTGTFTENQMTVRALWTSSGAYDVTGSGYGPEGRVLPAGVQGASEGTEAVATAARDVALHWSLLAGAACNDARVVREGDAWSVQGDPTEAAMLVAAGKGGVDTAQFLSAYPRRGALPFTSESQYMATLHAYEGPDGSGTGQDTVLVKGALERVLELCAWQMDGRGDNGHLNKQAVLEVAHRFAGTGLRVLATAMMHLPAGTSLAEANLRGQLTLTGLQAMFDPPREQRRQQCMPATRRGCPSR